MITKKDILSLYKRFPSPPAETKNLNLGLLDSAKVPFHNIVITEGMVRINTVNETSPFHEFPIRNISGIKEIDGKIAIILRNSIIFLNEDDSGVDVHINFQNPSLIQRLKYKLFKYKK